MAGIIYPRDWREILALKSVFADPPRPMNTADLDSLITVKIQEMARLFEEKFFDQEKYALALSGGLDSSILAILLSRQNVNFTAFTIGAGKRHPDIVFANMIARKLRIETVVCVLDDSYKRADNYETLFELVKANGFSHVINGDAIDEIMGGYWAHVSPTSTKKVTADASLTIENQRRQIFDGFWQRLYADHIEPLDRFAAKYGISVALPYLAAAPELMHLPLGQRAADKRRKILMRQLGETLDLPKELLQRPKLGLCNLFSRGNEINRKKTF
ncbi:asparagine synthase C-terminal domain-containing protein [Patescibacteria group bacterium]|nr:asparagine synthase C-terminal domain-containing protein [Patescibacteria group bacterium]